MFYIEEKEVGVICWNDEKKKIYFDSHEGPKSESALRFLSEENAQKWIDQSGISDLNIFECDLIEDPETGELEAVYKS